MQPTWLGKLAVGERQSFSSRPPSTTMHRLRLTSINVLRTPSPSRQAYKIRVVTRAFHHTAMRRRTQHNCIHTEYKPPFRSSQLTPPTTDDAFKSCLESNQRWAKSTASADPAFFSNLAKGQAPEILWLGCSDSRKPETTILGLQPGDVFTHRNIANIVSPTDLSLLSVVEFAVRHLKVKHVVLCGHTGCGGVAATLANGKLGILDVWLQPMRAIREQHAEELEKLEGAEKSTYMAKLNVQGGVEVLRRMPAVLEAIKERGLEVHGLIFNLATGLLEDLKCGEDEAVEKKRVAAFETK